MKILKKNIYASILLAFTVIATVGCSSKDDDLINQEGVKATVNGQVISQEEYDDALQAYKKMVETQYGEGAWEMEISEGKTWGSLYEDGVIIDNMIIERLLLEAANNDGITMSDEELQSELDVYKGYFNTEDEYQEFLKTNEMTEEYFKDALKREYIINHYIEKKIELLNPSDEELQELFDAKKMGQQVRASHILVETEEEAKAVIKRLNNGEDFATVSKEVSKDEGSKEKGGDLDFIKYTDNFVQEFLDASFSLEVDEISEPVKSQYGYHIIKVTDKKTDDTVTLESAKDSLVEMYKQTKYNELIENLKKNADIKIK
ncbi:MAG: peptidylprolyl isomerase [Tissierellia bacterium]|nr:peptidylprolyl isomerase [Tissierellia bacterium]